jgi:hypothetical protein
MNPIIPPVFESASTIVIYVLEITVVESSMTKKIAYMDIPHHLE